jgi:hypothetical protein
MCVDCILASPRIVQVDPDDEPLPEVVLSQTLAQAGRHRQGVSGGWWRMAVRVGGNGSSCVSGGIVGKYFEFFARNQENLLREALSNCTSKIYRLLEVGLHIFFVWFRL